VSRPNKQLQQTGHGAPSNGVIDPRATREGLSVIPLGRLTYLKGKPGGDNSMSGKPRYPEIAEGHAWRDPDDMVKADLLEPQCPLCKGLGLDTAIDIQGFQRHSPDRVAPGRTRSQEANPPLAGLRAQMRHLNHPERQRRAERGIPYRARAPRERSLRSSLRTGKPSTGQDAQAKGDRWAG